MEVGLHRDVRVDAGEDGGGVREMSKGYTYTPAMTAYSKLNDARAILQTTEIFGEDMDASHVRALTEIQNAAAYLLKCAAENEARVKKVAA